MGNLQFNMSDKQEVYIRGLIFKAQGSFLSNGFRYTMGSTIVRIVEEWCEKKGLIKIGKKEDKSVDEGIEVVEEARLTLDQAVKIIEDLDPDWDWEHQRGEAVRDYAKKLRGSK